MVCVELENFWNGYLHSSKFIGLNEYINSYMRTELVKAFNFRIFKYFSDIELGGSYFFNYMQLTNILYEYVTQNNFKDSIPKVDKKSNLDSILNKYNVATKVCDNSYQEICSYVDTTNDCCNVKYTNSDNTDNIYLLSASYVRFGKYSSIRDYRLTWENTCLGDIIINMEPEAIIEILRASQFYQLKFSSFTKNSPIVKHLKDKFKSYIYSS
jgi:hypothetical protein